MRLPKKTEYIDIDVPVKEVWKDILSVILFTKGLYRDNFREDFTKVHSCDPFIDGKGDLVVEKEYHTSHTFWQTEVIRKATEDDKKLFDSLKYISNIINELPNDKFI